MEVIGAFVSFVEFFKSFVSIIISFLPWSKNLRLLCALYHNLYIEAEKKRKNTSEPIGRVKWSMKM